MSVRIKPYTPEWSREFEKLRTPYQHHLHEFPCDVQHVGSGALC